MDRTRIGPDGRSATFVTKAGAIGYSGLWAADADGEALPSWLEADGNVLKLRVDDAGASYPITVDPVFQAAKLTSSDRLADDEFGYSIAVDGTTVVVGARDDDIGANTNQGSVYVFERPPGGWVTGTETQKLTAADGTDGDRFGAAVAIEGNTIVVGANQLAEAGQAGFAYIFEKPAATWVQSGKLTAAGGAAGDALGHAVAIEGTTVYAAAPGAEVDGDPAGGRIYIYEKPLTGWTNMGQDWQLAEGNSLNGELGAEISVSNGVLVAGAPSADFGETDQGAAIVFERPPGGWTNDCCEKGILVVSAPGANEYFGGSVGIDGDTIVVGAALEDHGAGISEDQGAVYVFEKPPTGWGATQFQTQTARLTASDPATDDQLGFRVEIEGNRIAAGANNDNVGSESNAGSVYVFEEPGGGWTVGYRGHTARWLPTAWQTITSVQRSR